MLVVPCCQTCRNLKPPHNTRARARGHPLLLVVPCLSSGCHPFFEKWRMEKRGGRRSAKEGRRAPSSYVLPAAAVRASGRPACLLVYSLPLLEGRLRGCLRVHVARFRRRGLNSGLGCRATRARRMTGPGQSPPQCKYWYA